MEIIVFLAYFVDAALSECENGLSGCTWVGRVRGQTFLISLSVYYDSSLTLTMHWSLSLLATECINSSSGTLTAAPGKACKSSSRSQLYNTLEKCRLYLFIFFYSNILKVFQIPEPGGDHRNNAFDFLLLSGILIGYHLRGAQSEYSNNNQMPFDCCDD